MCLKVCVYLLSVYVCVWNVLLWVSVFVPIEYREIFSDDDWIWQQFMTIIE